MKNNNVSKTVFSVFSPYVYNGQKAQVEEIESKDVDAFLDRCIEFLGYPYCKIKLIGYRINGKLITFNPRNRRNTRQH